MRHGDKINNLGRKSQHRKAMLANMASSLILHKRINTTLDKAKALRTYVEPLITKSKSDNTHSRRVVFSYLGDKNAVAELFREVAAKVGERPGGYTRILRTGFRKGDNAEMCFIELVDFNEAMLSASDDKKAKTTRRSRRSGGAKKKADGEVAEASAETTEAPAKEAKMKKQESPAPAEAKEEAAPEAKAAEAAPEAKAEETAKEEKKEEGGEEEKKAE